MSLDDLRLVHAFFMNVRLDDDFEVHIFPMLPDCEDNIFGLSYCGIPFVPTWEHVRVVLTTLTDKSMACWKCLNRVPSRFHEKLPKKYRNPEFREMLRSAWIVPGTDLCRRFIPDESWVARYATGARMVVSSDDEKGSGE